MGAGASMDPMTAAAPYPTVAAALADGKSQGEIDAFLLKRINSHSFFIHPRDTRHCQLFLNSNLSVRVKLVQLGTIRDHRINHSANTTLAAKAIVLAHVFRKTMGNEIIQFFGLMMAFLVVL